MLDDKIEKAGETNKPMELHKKFLQKILTRAFFLLAPAANPWLLQAFFLLVA